MGARSLAAIVVAGSLGAVSFAGAAVPTGLYGHVRVGPLTPVCREGVPCYAPSRAPLVFTRAGHSVRVVPAVGGGYRVVLAPGRYRVTTPALLARTLRVLRPSTALVRAGHIDRLDFTLDTGIR